MRFPTGSSTTTEQISLMLHARVHSDISSLLMNDSKVTERERETEREAERELYLEGNGEGDKENDWKQGNYCTVLEWLMWSNQNAFITCFVNNRCRLTMKC